LALWQAARVADLLERSGVGTALVVVDTLADRRLDIPLDRIGGQGVFVKEVQAAVVRGDADVAVHSAKDLPAAPALGAAGLVLAAFPERADPRDVLVGGTIDSLPTGALVATGSARRRVQLTDLRPDLIFTGLRGNLARRLSTVGEEDVVAVVVAKAAIDRLGWNPPAGLEVDVLETPVMTPQVGQGALAVECRADDGPTLAALGAIDDPTAGPLVRAERAFLAELGGGCTLPVGAHAVWTDVDPSGGQARPALRLSGMLASDDGRIVLRHVEEGAAPELLGRAVARYLLDDAGGGDLGTWTPSGTGTGSITSPAVA